MTAFEIGKKIVAMCNEGKAHQAIMELYAQDVVSVEAATPPGGSAESKGLDAVLGKAKWWEDNHEVHSAKAEGPFPHGDRFAVRFTYEITFKPTKQRRVMDEIGVYTVKNDKIAREEFFYST